MVREHIMNLVIETFRKDSERKNIANLPSDLTDYEQKFLYTIERLAVRFHCFKHNEIIFTPLLEIAKDNQIIDDLKALRDKDIDVLLRGKINDFLWVTRKDINSAKLAFEIYENVIFVSSDFQKQYYLFNRITNIYLSLRDKGLDFKYKSLLYKMIGFLKNNTNALSVNILEIAYEEKLLGIDELITPTREKLEQLICDESQYVTIAEAVFNLLEKMLFASSGVNVTSKPTKDKKITELRTKKADMYKKYAQSSINRTHAKINYIKLAIMTLKGVEGTGEQRAELQAQLKEIQKTSMGETHKFTSEVDITKQVKFYRAVIDALDCDEAIYYFICGFPILSQEESEKSMLTVNKDMLGKHLFTEVINDKNGKAKAILTKWSEAINGDKSRLLPHTEQYCSQIYSNYVNMGMTYVLGFIKEKYAISQDVIKKIIAESYYVPDERRASFVKGIMAGFGGDFITSMSILAPQIENAVRNLAEICGDSIMKINSDGTEEVLSLDYILTQPKINECIKDDILFNLKVIFTSKYGANIRNEVAHGLFDDKDFNDTFCYYAWWFTLRLCFEFSFLCEDILPDMKEKIKSIVDKYELDKTAEAK